MLADFDRGSSPYLYSLKISVMLKFDIRPNTQQLVLQYFCVLYFIKELHIEWVVALGRGSNTKEIIQSHCQAERAQATQYRVVRRQVGMGGVRRSRIPANVINICIGTSNRVIVG